ncbi:MAG: acetylornithine deacetylase [Acidobacteriota bacterium]
MLSDVDLLARLVAFDTTSHRSNLALVEFLADYLDRPGVRITRHPSPDGAKANLIVALGPASGPDGDGLVLSGHMDVVPALEDGWRQDPFELALGDERLVGRGAADMKGFLALASNLAASLDPNRLSAPLVLIFTYDEEVGTLGAKHLVESWAATPQEPLPRAAIIGEPTSLDVVGLHKGHLKARITLAGRSAHSGYPHLGINAIEAGGRVIDSLATLRQQLEAETPPGSNHFPEVPFVALNVGTVNGGSAINVVPDQCIVELGVRILPGMTSHEIQQRIQQAISGAAGVDHELEVLSDSPPLALAAEAPVAAFLQQATGRQKLRSVSFATDAGWLQKLGMDCVIFGPGSIEVAHRPNEFMPRDELAQARVLLSRTVEHFCGTSPASAGR